MIIIEIPAWMTITLMVFLLLALVCKIIYKYCEIILKRHAMGFDLWWALQAGDNVFHMDYGPGIVETSYRESGKEKGERMLTIGFDDGQVRVLYFDFHRDKIIMRKATL